MKLKRILAFLVSAALLPAALQAQETTVPGVIIRTTPPGAQITLLGEASVSGIAPAHFRQPLIGDYQLRVEKAGWETYRSELILDPTKQITVDVELARKTRFKAAARSFLVPGWGQKYADEGTKAATFFAAAVGSGVAFLLADKDFDDKNGTFLARQREYDRIAENGTEGELEDAWNRLIDAQGVAHDAENVRRATIGLAVGVWALNMIDVLFFFPEEQGTFSIKGIAVSPGAVNDGVGVLLSTDF